MCGFIAIRLIRLVPVVILISIATFVLLHLLPGGPIAVAAGARNLSESDIERLERNLGLGKPLAVQYFDWLKKAFFRLDFGYSYSTGEPISWMILSRIPATLELMGTAFVIAIVIAVAVGALSAARRDKFSDQFLSVWSAVGMSIPIFWLGIVAIYIFSVRLGLLPSGGREAIEESSLSDRISHLVLPACVLAFSFASSWSRYIRAYILEAIDGEFIKTARAKGLGEKEVLLKHALRPALLPFVSVAVLHLPALFTGAVITETVFSWPGMGRMFYEGLVRQDYPRVMGIVVISSFFVILSNLVGDILACAIDPRISAFRKASMSGASGEKL